MYDSRAFGKMMKKETLQVVESLEYQIIHGSNYLYLL
jgi:hypothetical protein